MKIKALFYVLIFIILQLYRKQHNSPPFDGSEQQ